MSHIGVRPPPGSQKRTFDIDDTSPFCVCGNTHVFPHGLGTIDVIVQCFGLDGRQIYPARVDIVDYNNVRIVFSGDQAGRCIIMG